MHVTLIAIHATAGIAALIAGLAAIRRRRWFPPYLSALIVTLLALAAVVALDWSTLNLATRGVYAGFLVFAAVLIGQGERARRAQLQRATRGHAADRTYTAAVGFTVVALFDAFVVIAVLDLGAPVWLLVVVGVLIAAVGHSGLSRQLRRIPAGNTIDRRPTQ